ncbi:MAG: heme-binding protein [Pyrinomonadaceae bacterium]|nr:heme-binding protein [Pyrinomonadaceae bacterium]
MNNSGIFTRRRQAALCALLLSLAAVAAVFFEQVSSAQTTRPILISEANSTRAIALDSVTRLNGPFAFETRAPFVSDRRTRLQLYALNIDPSDGPSALTVEAEDGARRVYPLVVEHIGKVPGQPWLHSVTVKLHDGMANVGDVLVRLTYRGAASNRVRVGIGHTGGGLADDAGSVPTPAPAATAPTPNTNPLTAGILSADDVRTVISQAVSAAAALNRPVTVAVTDREGNVLGVFRMNGAPATTRIRSVGAAGQGLENLDVPAELAAISKAGTPSLFGTSGNAFTPRTAGFIIQEHIPPSVDNRPGGPLYGVQFSSLPCSDVKVPGLPLGLSGDPGGIPIYKNGVPSGGVGIEGDGLYIVDRDPRDFDQPFEEVIAVAAGRGFEPPEDIRANLILVNGVGLPYANVNEPLASAQIPFANLPGMLVTSSLPGVPLPAQIRGARPSQFVPSSVGGVIGAVDTRFFPFSGAMTGSPNALTASDVTRIISQAAQQADRTRAAIRRPLGSAARVSITVVDSEGRILGIFRTFDAPVFGFDVSGQKARSALLFSRNNSAALLRGAGMGSYVDRAATDGIQLNGSIAFSARGEGFMHRPLFPDGLNNTAPGAFSTGLGDWSPFNVGLQLDLLRDNLLRALGGENVRCSTIPLLANGLQIFAGGVPLYKNGELVGAIGISGDGIDQDDIICSAGAAGYAPPEQMRSDQVFVRNTRLPYVKFPPSPNL